MDSSNRTLAQRNPVGCDSESTDSAVPQLAEQDFKVGCGNDAPQPDVAMCEVEDGCDSEPLVGGAVPQPTTDHSGAGCAYGPQLVVSQEGHVVAKDEGDGPAVQVKSAIVEPGIWSSLGTPPMSSSGERGAGFSFGGLGQLGSSFAFGGAGFSSAGASFDSEHFEIRAKLLFRP